MFRNFLTVKQIIAIFALGVGIQASIVAQPTFSLKNAEGSYQNGEAFCAKMFIDDFTDITSFQFAITWDTTIMQLESVGSFNLEMLDSTDFDLSQIRQGVIRVDWEEPSGSGLTINTRSIDDNFSIFELCFRTSQECGGEGLLNINGASAVVFRTGVNTNIGIFDENVDALITVEGQPITLLVGEAMANPEEVVCVPIFVESFTNIQGTQFTVRWDTSMIQFVSLEPNPEFPFLSSGSFSTVSSGKGFVTVTIFDNSGSSSGINVPDGTKMFDICFLTDSEGGKIADIVFSSDPTPIEVATIRDGARACKQLKNGRIVIKEEVGAVTIKSSSAAVKPGASTCIDVTVKDFFAVNALKLSIGWSADTIRFDSITNFGLRGLDIGDFNLTNTASGILTLDWTDEIGVLLQDDTRLFSICYTAIGPVGSSSKVAFTEFPTAPFVKTTLTGEQDAGLNTRNGIITILPPQSLNLSITNATASPGERFCVDILAENFTDIVNLQYSMGWETTLIEFESVTAIGLNGMSVGNFDLTNAANGLLTVDWSSLTAAGETLVDGAVVYSLCFIVKPEAQLGLCNTIFFSDIPNPIKAITKDSNGNSIEVTDQGNDICIFDPDGFTVKVQDVAAVNPQETICIPIEVTNFGLLNKIQFSLNWNPSVLNFVSVNPTGNLPGLDADDFTLSLSNLGIISVTWNAASTEGVTLDNGTAIFELCLQAVGDRLSCTKIDISSAPLPFVVNSSLTADQNLSLNPLHGEVCIADALAIDGVFIVQPSCDDSSDGSIEVIVSGGNPNYNYSWSNGSLNSISTNLAAGTYTIIITDPSGLRLTDTIELTAANPSPVAMAGPDRNLSCGANTISLTSLQSSAGQDIRYDWMAMDGGNIVGSSTSQTIIVRGAGNYELTVSNSVTGCSATDTVMVTSTEDPEVNAGDDENFTCNTSTITLDGTGTEESADLTYQWAALDGGSIVSDSTTLRPIISAPGTYVLSVIHTRGCVSRDTIVVRDARVTVEARAGIDQTLNCSGDPVTLDGSASSAGGDFVAKWSAVETGIVPPTPTNNIVTQVFNPGSYVLELTNVASGCSAIDTVVVIPDEELPVIVLGFIDELDCSGEGVPLNVSLRNVENFSVQWLLNDSVWNDPQNQDTLLVPVVTEPGTYEIIVTNTETGCTATRNNIIVNQIIDFPIAEAGIGTTIGCADTASAILSPVGSSAGDNFVYAWTSSLDSTIILTRADGSAEVFDPATFYLNVTDITNGCTTVDSVRVRPTENYPIINFVRPIPIPCTGGESQIDASGSTGATTYFWTRIEGESDIQDDQTNIITVNRPGLFGLRITNEEGCIAFDSIRVTQADTSSVQLTVDVSATDLTCTVNSSTINVQAIPSDGTFIYNWISEAGENLGNASTSEVTQPGLIILEVTEVGLNCTKQQLIVVNQDNELSTPQVSNPAESLVLDCSGTPIVLDASATNPTPVEQFTWIRPDGLPLADTSLTPSITEPGNYKFILSNPENGCTDSVSLVVESASELEANIDEPDMLTCSETRILLRGFNSSQGQNIVFEWSSADGNEITPTVTGDAAFVSAPGTYILSVRDRTTQCDATAEVVVVADTLAPTADAGQDIDLGCGDPITIGGTATDLGANFNYAWTLNGTEVANGSATTNIENPGTYMLTVLNMSNGCTATDEIVVTQILQLEDADAGNDEMTCDTEVALMGNLPSNATGTWSVNSKAKIAALDQANTSATELEAGENFFIWTLSTAECPNYSADTLSVEVEKVPVANDDVAFLDLDKQDSIAILVIANDNLLNINNWDATITTKPIVGTVTDFVDGVARYTARTLKDVEDRFVYTVCNANCPDLCDSATVYINVMLPKDGSNPLLDNLQNTITPNGDGKNDQLIFDIILDGTEQFPDNQMIIFNRWGDIVYEAIPYQNDWDGKNEKGQDLPQGTYYYILRLDVANGVILIGDVTILR